jgi:7,8-dihydropterin-6-yl-methyl-4-(beta-D-ribofuranosyl)aminobenzene 5'-phosphate synthase
MSLRPIEACEVLVLVDNVSDLLSTVPDHITPEVPNVVKAGAGMLAGRCMCCAQWGLSLIVTARDGQRSKTLLFDSGPEGHGVERNGDRLGVLFGEIDAAVFSHGHWDHVGGMTTALSLIRGEKGGAKTAVHVNEGMFVDRAIVLADGSRLPFASVPSPDELEAAGGEIVMGDEPRLLLDDMFYLSGEIARITPYEKGLLGQVRRTASGEWEKDELILDERFVAVHVGGKGIIVFTACSHAGVVNVLHHARNVFDPIPLYGVMGGFHLSGRYCQSIIPDTVADLRQFDLKVFVPGHCTGWRATHKLVETFREERVFPSAVGQRHRFTA